MEILRSRQHEKLEYLRVMKRNGNLTFQKRQKSFIREVKKRDGNRTKITARKKTKNDGLEFAEISREQYLLSCRKRKNIFEEKIHKLLCLLLLLLLLMPSSARYFRHISCLLSCRAGARVVSRFSANETWAAGTGTGS